jgi:hypothetical protein
MIPFLLSSWRTICIAFLAGLVAGGGGVWWLRDQMAAKSQLQAARVVIRTIQGQERVTTRVVTRYVQGAERIRTVTRTIDREIPIALPPETDRSYPLPRGLIRLHDAAALGVPPVSDPSGGLDAEPSPVTTSQLAAAFTDNYGAYRECALRLESLQEWVKEQQALASR